MKNTLPNSLRKVAVNAFNHALEAVLPEHLIHNVLTLDTKCEQLIVTTTSNESTELCHTTTFPLAKTPNILVLGAGKASQSLTIGLLQILAKTKIPNIQIHIILNYPNTQSPISIPKSLLLPWVTIELHPAPHPIPNQHTIDTTTMQIKALQSSPESTLLITLFSGGGSALFELLTTDNRTNTTSISLEDIQNMHNLLIKSGANIGQINTLRKHFSCVKGGGLAKIAKQSGKIQNLIGLYLSDVIGNDLSNIASGPTCPDPSTFSQCLEICKNYQLWDNIPISIKKHIQLGLNQPEMETLKPGNPSFQDVHNVLIGSATNSAQAATRYLQDAGFQVHLFGSGLQGEAREFGQTLPLLVEELVKSSQSYPRNAKMAFVATGEFTVTIQGANGVGGRNQEMLASLLEKLLILSPMNVLNHCDFVVVGGAMDGLEGNSIACGAIVDTHSTSRLIEHFQSFEKAHRALQSSLDENDTFSIFQILQDALIVGDTGTNVNDLLIILINDISNVVDHHHQNIEEKK